MQRRGKTLSAGRALALAVVAGLAAGWPGEAQAQAGQAVPSASTLFVKRRGDTMTGPLSFWSPFGTNRPALWFRHATGTAMAIAPLTGGYDLALGEATSAASSITPRLVITTAGSFPVVVGGGWASSTLYSLKAKSVAVAGGATGTLSCSSTFTGDVAQDTTTTKLTWCDGTTRQNLATEAYALSTFWQASTQLPLVSLALACVGGSTCADNVVNAAQVLPSSFTSKRCRITAVPRAAGTSGTYTMILRNATGSVDLCTLSIALPATVATVHTTECASLTVSGGSTLTLRRNGGSGDPQVQVNAVCY